MKLRMKTAATALVLIFSVMMPSAEAGAVITNEKAKRMSILDLLTNVNLERSRESSQSNQPSKSSQTSESKELSELNQLSESNQPPVSSLFLQRHDSSEGSKTRHTLMKRWGRQMFGCHCSGFHIHCHSDSYCSARYGHGYKCKKSCCGMACGH